MKKKRDFDVVVVGELNADLILSGDVEPRFDQVEKLVGDVVLSMGSSSAIFACGAARLGLKVAFIGKVGDDTFGQYVIDQLKSRGVDIGGVVVDKSIKTGLSVILNRSADRAILTYSGSIGALHYDEIDLKSLARARHLHLGSYFMLDTLRPDIPALFRAARAQDMTISIDTNYDPREKWDGGLVEVLSLADIFLPNEKELCAITGLEELSEAAYKALEWTPTLAVKFGARGGRAFRGSERVFSDVVDVKVVDTVGAGDTFDAGFIYSFLKGWDLQRSIRMACVCGSLSTRAAGGIAGQPTLKGVKPYL